MFNILQDTDSYKISMDVQYPAGARGIHSYVESRGGIHDKTVVFGTQFFVKTMLENPLTPADVNEAAEMYADHGEPFPRHVFDHIVAEYGGYWPVHIKTVPEGTVLPTHQSMVTVENQYRDPLTRLATTWLETRLLSNVWYGTTVATNSYMIKQVIKRYMVETGCDLAGLPFKLHDFGSRGASSQETAVLGGIAHLVNFMGTDTTAALFGAKKFYGAKGAAGFSIPAAEHSTITSWGKAREFDAYRNMIKQFSKPGSIYAVVSDSYDFQRALTQGWCSELKEDVINGGGTLVVRPDSGNPVEMVMFALRALDDAFGHTLTLTGHKLLKGVRVIQGDGINADVIEKILFVMKANGFAADNVAFGMGGALLQGVTRDDQKFAMKCSAAFINNKWEDVQKDPITDPGKKSKAGRQKLIKLDGEFKTVRADDPLYIDKVDEMGYIYNLGSTVYDDFAAIRARANG